MKTTTLAFKKNSAVTIVTLAVIGLVAALIIAAVPHHASAASISVNTTYCAEAPDTLFGGGNEKLEGMIKFIVCFLEQSIVPFLFAVTIVVFFWGMIKFIFTDDASERETGKQFMLWGIIGLTVMFCVWGLVYILSQTFGVPNVIPQLPVD